MVHLTGAALSMLLLLKAGCASSITARDPAIIFDVPPPGVVVPLGCDEIQCAPFFVCVTRPVTCMSNVCPPISTVPLCVPGDSAACSRLGCSATEKCIYEETPCPQAPCTPVATCVPITSGPSPPSVRPPSTQPTSAPTTATTTTTTTTTTAATTITGPTTTNTTTIRPTTTTTTRRPTTTTTTRRPTTATTRRTTTRTTRRPTTRTTRRTTTRTTRRPKTTTHRYTWKPTFVTIPGIRISRPQSYPVAPPGGTVTPGGRPVAPVSMPSPGGSSRPSPSPAESYPLPPPGVPGSVLGPTNGGPPPVQPLPSGVYRPSPPTVTQTVSAARPSSRYVMPSAQTRPSPSGYVTIAPGTTTMSIFGVGNGCDGVRCFVGFACFVDSMNRGQCVPPFIAQQLSGRQTPNSGRNIGISKMGKSAYVFPKQQPTTTQAEQRKWPSRFFGSSGSSNTVTNTVWNNGASSYAVPRTSAQIPQSPALKSKPNWEESGSSNSGDGRGRYAVSNTWASSYTVPDRLAPMSPALKSKPNWEQGSFSGSGTVNSYVLPPDLQ